MKTWKAMVAGLLLTMFLAASCATLSAPRGPLTEEEEERYEEMFPYVGD